MKPAYAKHAACAAAAFLLAISITGCQLSDSNPPHADSAYNEPNGLQPSNAEDKSDSPQKTYDTKDNGVSLVADEGLSGDGAATIADAATGSSASKTGKTPPAATKNEEAWNAKAPKLLGIAIGETRSIVVGKLGKPSDSYSLDNDDDKLTVEEYAAYSIGYAADKKVKFVEVFDKAATTGLGGLRIGDTGTEAFKALGKPTTHTASVLAYEADGALLKLDLDPQTSRILSIKLFAAKN